MFLCNLQENSKESRYKILHWNKINITNVQNRERYLGQPNKILIFLNILTLLFEIKFNLKYVSCTETTSRNLLEPTHFRYKQQLNYYKVFFSLFYQNPIS